MLPPVRRTKRRDWGRVVARILCVVFALVGLVPVALGVLVRTSWARRLATEETQKVAKKYGVDATYDLQLRLWPLTVTLRNLRVEASDGGTPVLTARSATAKPKIFGLLAGKLVIDQVEVEQPNARVVLKDGQVQNLALKLPETPKKSGPFKPPFSVVSASQAEVDVDIDGIHVTGHEIDADLTTDDDGEGGTAYEVALRVAEARGRRVRPLPPPTDGTKPEHDFAVDEDVLCRIDARARIEPKRILVRRLTTYGGFDLDPAEETGLDCNVSKTDKRYVEVNLGHLAVGLPKPGDEYPTLDGHVLVRAPLQAIKRLPNKTPLVDGWVSVDVELRYTAETPIPDLSGRLEGEGIRVERFTFAQKLTSDVRVQRSIVTSPHTRVEIADGVAEISDVEVKPLQKGIPLRVGKMDISKANFTTLMRDFHVSEHPHVTWDLDDVKVVNFHGQIEPMGIIGDLNAHTANFAVYDAPTDSPTKVRATGVREGHLVGKVAATPQFLQFQHVAVRTTHSVVEDVTVQIGYHEIVRVDVPHAKIDIGDLSPFGRVKMAGIADINKVVVAGSFGDPKVEGDISNIQNFSIGDLPFGTVTQGHVESEVSKLIVNLRDIRAQKGKSTYELSTGQLDFSGHNGMRMDGQIASKNLDVRDFFNVFKLDEDPRLTQIGGTLETNARMHLALGGPEDACGGGYLDVQASVNAHQLELLGEKFDEGHMDVEYRWLDQQAGLDGAEVDVRSLSLIKVKKEGRAPLGSALGSLVVHRGGEMRGSMVVQGFPLGRADLLGPLAPKLEGAISGVAQIGGTLEAYNIDADLDVTPVRIMGAPFGGSDIHLTMTQVPSKAKIIGKTRCGAPIKEPFNKEAWLHDTSVQGSYTMDGALFGGQVKLDHAVVTRQKSPVITGHIGLERFDLGPIGKLLVAKNGDEADPNAGAPTTVTGELTGDVDLERIATDDIVHAKARFTPRAIRVTRAGQTLSLRTSPSSAPGVVVGPPIVIALADDTLKVPPITFDLAAPNGFRGAFAVKGAVNKVTRGAELALEAELSPIDLGILVGIVPKMTRAIGTLSGSVKLRGKATQPEFDGQVKVRGGEFGFKGLPGGITDVEVDAVADENEARITRATGHFLGGDVGVTARMPLKGGQLGIAEATITGRQLFFSPLDGVKAALDADLQLTLNPTATTPQGRLPVIGGEVTITSFEYTRPITIDLTAGFRGSKRTVVENYDPSLDAVTLGFDVRSKVPLRFRNNLVDGQLAIDPRGLRVTGTNQRIGLRGEMTTLAGGHVRVFANDFEVQKGTIHFDDPTKIAPHVDITALTEYRRYNNTLASAGAGANTTGGAGATSGNVTSGGQGGSLWRITLHAYGDADDLKIDMTSDPALSREDIFLLLTIGLTRAELDQVRGNSAYGGAAFEAIGTVSGVDRAVKQALPVIDDFRPGTAYSPRTGRVEPNITVGRRLGENVRARLTSGLAEDPQLRSTIEWRLGRSFTVEPSYDRINTVSSSTVGNFGLDFRWRLEFD
jgi:translocation and assembly module TamB